MQPGAWTFAPLAILEARNLSPGAKNAYMAICSFIWPRGADRITAAEKIIAEGYGVTDRTFRRHAAELAKVHAIGIVRRSGVASTYVLLDLDKADLGRADRQEPTPEIQPEPESEPRTIEVGVDRHKTEHAKTNIRKTSRSSIAATNRRKLAIAFLQAVFREKNTQQGLLRQHSPEEILWAKRELDHKPGRVKNPPGLVVYFLGLPKDKKNLTAAANEVEHEAMKKALLREDQVERAREQREQTEKSLTEWLNEQPDKAETLEQAKEYVKLELKGSKANFQTVFHATRGYLWKIRRQRERN